MKARKENKVYSITTDQEKQRYLKAGYDIYSDDGKLLEYSPQKKISYSQYDALLKENEALRRETASLREEIEVLQEKNSVLQKEAEVLKAGTARTDKPEPGKAEGKEPGKKAGK